MAMKTTCSVIRIFLYGFVLYTVRGQGVVILSGQGSHLREDNRPELEVVSYSEASPAPARDNTTASAGDNTTASARDNMTASTRDNMTASTRDNITASTRDNITASTRDNTTASVRDITTASARDNTAVPARDNATESARDNTAVSARDNATESARDNMTGSAWDNSNSEVVNNSATSFGNIHLHVVNNTETTATPTTLAQAMGNRVLAIVNNTSGVTGGDDENDDDGPLSLFSQLANVSSLEDFLPLLRFHGRPVNRDDIFSGYDSVTGKQIVHGGGRMAEPDDCSPRHTTVRLHFENNDPKVVYFPKCTKIERCGGCCSSPNLQCVPAYTERVSLKVIKAELPGPNSPHLVYNGFAPVIIDRHVTCRVQCNLTPEKCGPKKKFLSNQCDCKCLEYQRCEPPHIWDPETCQCICPEVQNCCREGEPCVLSFNKVTCECDVDANILTIRSANNQTIDEREAYLNHTSLNHPAPQNLITPTTQTTTSTTVVMTTATTSSTPAVIVNPCASVNCPQSFRKTVNSAGLCVCSSPYRQHRNRISRNRHSKKK